MTQRAISSKSSTAGSTTTNAAHIKPMKLFHHRPLTTIGAATLLVLLLQLSNVHAYISYSTYKYPSIPSSTFGIPLSAGDRFLANLFEAPSSDPQMCSSGTFGGDSGDGDRSRRRTEDRSLYRHDHRSSVRYRASGAVEEPPVHHRHLVAPPYNTNDPVPSHRETSNSEP